MDSLIKPAQKIETNGCFAFHLCSNGVRLYRDGLTLNIVQHTQYGTIIVTVLLADLETILEPRQSWWSRFVRRHIVDDDPYPEI